MHTKKYYITAPMELKEAVGRYTELFTNNKITGATLVELAMGLEQTEEIIKYLSVNTSKNFKGDKKPTAIILPEGDIDIYCLECGESSELGSTECHYCGSKSLDVTEIEPEEVEIEEATITPAVVSQPEASLPKVKAYMRLSNSDRLEDNGFQRQKGMIEGQFQVTEWYEDVISGAIKSRPQLDKMITELEEGDIVVIPAIDRLSRSTVDLLELVQAIKDKGATLKSINEPWLDTTSDNPMSEFLLTVMGALSQMERSMISDRIKKGKEVAKAKGIKFGRPLQNGDQVQHALDLYKSGEMSTRQIEKSTGVSRSTLMRRVRELKEAGQL